MAVNRLRCCCCVDIKPGHKTQECVRACLTRCLYLPDAHCDPRRALKVFFYYSACFTLTYTTVWLSLEGRARPDQPVSKQGSRPACEAALNECGPSRSGLGHRSARRDALPVLPAHCRRHTRWAGPLTVTARAGVILSVSTRRLTAPLTRRCKRLPRVCQHLWAP